MITGLSLVILTGLLAGFVHVVTGADHMAALLPLSVGRHWRAAWLGVRWGIGHSVGVLIIGALAVLLRRQIDMVIASGWGERVVGVMLIAIGLLGIRWALRQRVHTHVHNHDGSTHRHAHVHTHDAHPAGDPPGEHSHVRQHAALLAGIVHGASGGNHLIFGVIPALALASWAQSACYMGGFAAGTIVAMGLFAAVVGFASVRLGSRTPAVVRGTMLLASAATILVGMYWIIWPVVD